MSINKPIFNPHQQLYKIIIASDHAGFSLKTAIKKWLQTEIKYLYDAGIYTYYQVSDYPVVIKNAAQEFQTQIADFAILICGSGIGVNIAANRYVFWRAFRYTVNDSVGLKLARQHNNANVITFGASLLSFAEIQTAIIDFLNTSFDGQLRHCRRINLLSSFH